MIEIGQVNLGDSEVEYSNSSMKLKINNGDFTRGGIQLTNNEIAWKNENSSEGFTIPWGKIVVTAISQDPQRCIYFMIDSKWTEDENKPAESNSNGNGANGDRDNENDEEGSETESESAMTEFWLIPEDSGDVDNIYYFMSKYPAADEGMEESDGDEEFLDGEDMEQMNINDDDPRFADS